MSDSPTPPPGRVYEVLTPGDTLGEYTVECCLSYDILGSLYRVTGADGSSKTLFVLPKILSDDESFMRRFGDLRSMLQQLNHPAIISLGESATIADRICFTAETVSGKSIPDYLGAAGIYPTYKNPQGILRAHPSEESKDFTPEKVRRVARTMLEALDYAHAKSTLHLNLTPSNVILTDAGDAKVVGFGMYSIIGQAAIEALISAGIPAVSLGPRNVRLNTADIISPEVNLKQDPDARTDIFAFGVSVYWMITGLKPAANYRPPSGIVPGLEPGWDIFLARCLAREKAKRYPTAAAALKDLDNLEHLTTGGYANDPARAAKPKADGRKKMIIAAATALTLAVVAGVVVATLSGGSPAIEDRVPAGSPYVRAEGAKAAFVFKTAQAGVKIVALKNNATFAVTDGALAISAPPGISRFSVQADGATSRIIALHYDGKKTVTAPIVLAADTGTAEIATAPNAMVSVENAERGRNCLGVTNENGILAAGGVPVGKYTLIVEKEKCPTTSSADFEIKSGAKTTKSVLVEGMTGTLILESTPDGAQISIDGVDSGTTPMTLEKLKPGSQFTIVFSKPNYRPVTRKVVVDAGEKITVKSGPMPPAKGVVEYAVTYSGKPVDEATLSLLRIARNDDQFRKRDWPESQKLPKEIAVGHYMLKAEHPDCEPFQTAFVIQDEKTTRVNIALRALPSPLQLTVTPERTAYTLRINNNEYRDQPPPSVPANIPLHIEVEARDFEIWKTDVVGKPRQPVTLNASLKRLTEPKAGTPYVVPYLGIAMVWVPAGTTRLGSPLAETGRTEIEGPFTWATYTKGYWMSATEITQEEFERVLGYNPSRIKKSTHPADSISYADALRFCKAINERERRTGRLPFGYEYRLPNEIEWEYACRAGTTTAFHFGDTATAGQANFVGAYPQPVANAAEPGSPKKVATYPANAYGLYDMHGNVREWVIEQYKPHLPGGKRTDYNVPVASTESDECFTRGGSYRMNAVDCRAAARPASPIRPDSIEDDIGFRIVLAPSPLP